MLSGKGACDEDVFCYYNLTLRNRKEEEVLGVTKDRKLTSHQYTKIICRKAGQTLSICFTQTFFVSWSQRKENNILYSKISFK